MEDELFFEAKKYLSSKVAGQRAGYTHDYVSRLARQGKIPGRLVGRTWYVEEDSFLSFLEKHSEAKQRWYEKLSVERKNGHSEGIPKQVSNGTIGSRLSPIPWRAIYRESSAIFAAAILVFGTYYLATAPAAEEFRISFHEASRMLSEEVPRSITELAAHPES